MAYQIPLSSIKPWPGASREHNPLSNISSSSDASHLLPNCLFLNKFDCDRCDWSQGPRTVSPFNLSCPAPASQRPALDWADKTSNWQLSTVKVVGSRDMWIIRVQLSPQIHKTYNYKTRNFSFHSIEFCGEFGTNAILIGEFCSISYLIPADIWLLYRVGLTDCNH